MFRNYNNNNGDISFNYLQGNSDEEAGENDLVWSANARYSTTDESYFYYSRVSTSYLDEQKYILLYVHIEPLNYASLIRLSLEVGGLKIYFNEKTLITDTLDPPSINLVNRLTILISDFVFKTHYLNPFYASFSTTMLNVTRYIIMHC
jgi:hypothetical protein